MANDSIKPKSTGHIWTGMCVPSKFCGYQILTVFLFEVKTKKEGGRQFLKIFNWMHWNVQRNNWFFVSAGVRHSPSSRYAQIKRPSRWRRSWRRREPTCRCGPIRWCCCCSCWCSACWATWCCVTSAAQSELETFLKCLDVPSAFIQLKHTQNALFPPWHAAFLLKNNFSKNAAPPWPFC